MPPFTTDLLKRTIIDDTRSVGPADRAIIGAPFSDGGDRVRDYRVVCGFCEREAGGGVMPKSFSIFGINFFMFSCAF